MSGSSEQRGSSGARPLRVLAVDKVAVLRNNRERYHTLVERADVELTLLAPTRWLENCVMEPYQPESGEPYTTVLGTPSWPGRELRSIYYTGIVRALRRSRPEVILLMEESFSLFALQVVLLKMLFAPRAKVIFYSFNITSYKRFPYRPSWFYRLLGDTVMAMCHAGLCVSRRAEMVLRESSFKGRIQVLFFGINDKLFTATPRDEARERLALPRDAKLFLYAGRLLEQKGIQDLVDAFARLHAERPRSATHLLIVGDGEYGEVLQARVAALGPGPSIEFRHAVPIEQMATYMSAADAFVLPSRADWNEQFGRVNAEAMLVGTTIIGSTSGEIPVVIEDGGYIFTAGDVEDLKRTMERILDDPADAAARRVRGREIAMKKYSLLGFVDGLIELFSDLTGRAVRRAEAGG
ncbi:MAG: glycosyltransferase family 4 protein [Bacteroidetes bacterium]|nr:glycosyltransferase family 4 protein [Bacteroidota bacterium]